MRTGRGKDGQQCWRRRCGLSSIEQTPIAIRPDEAESHRAELVPHVSEGIVSGVDMSIFDVGFDFATDPDAFMSVLVYGEPQTADQKNNPLPVIDIDMQPMRPPRWLQDESLMHELLAPRSKRVIHTSPENTIRDQSAQVRLEAQAITEDTLTMASALAGLRGHELSMDVRAQVNSLPKIDFRKRYSFKW